MEITACPARNAESRLLPPALEDKLSLVGANGIGTAKTIFFK